MSGRLDRGWAARMGPARSTVAVKLLPPDHLVAGDLYASKSTPQLIGFYDPCGSVRKSQPPHFSSEWRQEKLRRSFRSAANTCRIVLVACVAAGPARGAKADKRSSNYPFNWSALPCELG